MTIIRLCVDCFNCRTKGGKYYCILGHFFKNSQSDIMIYTPEDFGCNEWEDDE
jgi:hypothetical protein